MKLLKLCGEERRTHEAAQALWRGEPFMKLGEFLSRAGPSSSLVSLLQSLGRKKLWKPSSFGCSKSGFPGVL